MDNSGEERISHVERGNESEIALPEIDSKLLQLRQFEIDLQNDEVTKAIIALHRVFDPQFEWLASRNIVITYHGSLQYNDPRNLDADVEFMGDNLGFKDVKRWNVKWKMNWKNQEFGLGKIVIQILVFVALVKSIEN